MNSPGASSSPPIDELLRGAVAARRGLFDDAHLTAFRLFNGFTEGCPQLTIDVYASTAVINGYADPAPDGEPLVAAAQRLLHDELPWITAIILKTRNSPSIEEQHGKLLVGAEPAEKIIEHGPWYAVNLTRARDSSLYLDTRLLRRWAIDHLRGKTVLNAFAHTGSLGVAAMAGGATRVLQLDRNRQALDLARLSCALNHFPIRKADFVAQDFFRHVAGLRQRNVRFDCVFIDPPFFSTAPSGVIDQVHESARLINKVRPLVNRGGWLVAINNALYVSGAAYMETLNSLCADGYLEITELIPVPEDFTGYPQTRRGALITDPAPFNHSTKIAVLRVRQHKMQTK
jgi:23S rRNA (cytosine1962-C5)-methyltransferase